jgi:hypothetical protein
MTDITIALSKPITVPGKDGAVQLNELTMREVPDIVRLALYKGMPHTMLIERTADGSTKVEIKINPTLAREYISKMCGISELALEQLAFRDVRALQDAMIQLLNPTDA